MPPPGPQENWTHETLVIHFEALLESSEKLQAERFNTFKEAFDISFRAQQESTVVAFATQKEAVSAALAAADRAVLKAENAAEKRFESVNEFRNTLSDQQRNLMPRSEVSVMLAALTDRLNVIQTQMDGLNAERLGVKGGWGYAVGAIGLIVTLLSIAAFVFKFKP